MDSRAQDVRRGSNTTERSRPPDPFARREYTDRSLDEVAKEIENERDVLEHFLEDNESSTPSRDAEVIRKFCRRKAAVAPAQPQPDIRLEDREHGTKRRREYPLISTSDDLFKALKIDRFGVTGMPNADYRQIRIHNLNPESLIAIARTAALHQVNGLRDAFLKHISCATSFRVYGDVIGFVAPRLELHLPYLCLRKVSGSSKEWKSRDINQEAEAWLDIGLPESELGANGEDRFLITQAHISVVLCIWDKSKWVGYAFSKGGPTDTSVNEDSGEYSDGEDDDDPVPKEDIFAPRNVCHNLWAEDAVLDPRTYFLRIADVWICYALREYTYLVRVLESCVEAWMKEFRRTVSNVSISRHQDQVTWLSDNSIKLMQLLRHVKERISYINQSCADFEGPYGDTFCFNDLIDVRRNVLKSIRTSARDFNRLEQALGFLVRFCEESTKDLELLIELQSVRLMFESNKLNADSNLLQYKAHQLNYDTYRMSSQMQEFNRQNAVVALETGRLTRTNVLMIWITTPILVALQYFTADQPIFTSFDRSPRNFGISLLILAFALPALTCTCNYMSHLLGIIAAKVCLKKTGVREDVENVGPTAP